MTEKQKRFADEYILTGNAAEAARRAGYSKRSAKQIGRENLTKLDLQINARLKELESAKTLTLQEGMEHLTSCVRGELTEIIVTPSGKKVKVPVKETERLKALDLYFRVSGAYKDRTEISLSGGEVLAETLERIWKKRLKN